MLADGVLLSGFGGPDCPDAVGPFMRNLTGRDPDPAVLARVKARYERIGGCSPLALTARELAAQVRSALAATGREMPVEVGMRYWHPTIGDAVAALADGGARCIAHVSLSPLEAAVTHARYREAIDEAISARAGLSTCEAPQLASLDAYRRLHADALKEALESVGSARALVAFTAHSLPVADDGAEAYAGELVNLSRAVAREVGLSSGHAIEVAQSSTVGDLESEVSWVVCYQSKGARGGQWLAPDLEDVIAQAVGLGFEAVVAAPVGFALDHMETLYDLDVEARATAEEEGLSFVRSRVPNAHPALANAIAEVVLGVGCDQG
ncbi:protoheme ferro-lyase [Coriobacteriaceae bacterium EMTCatB1]|nr:protoheme ferro-lyase [Coriobacteriaceae bacterium EMTCatB1]